MKVAPGQDLSSAWATTVMSDALQHEDAGTANRALLALILPLGAFALRLYLLDDKSVWWDEAISAWTARKDFAEIAVYQAGAVHPPLHYWFLHLWRAFAGDGEFALRLSSVLFGVLAVAVLYRLGTRFASPWAGALAAGLLALSRFHVWWSQEIRMYALATLLALLSLYWFLRLAEERRGRVEVAYCAATVLLIYTLYLGILTVLAQNVAMLVALVARRGPRRASLARFLRWTGLQLVVALLYAPWLYLMLRYKGQRSTLDTPIEPWLLARIYATVVTLGVDVDIERYGWLVLGLMALACGSLLLWRRGLPRPLAGTALLYLALPPAITYLLSLPSTAFYTPAIHARYFLLVAPAWYLLLGLAVAAWRYRARWLALAIATVLVALGGFFTLDYYADRFKLDDYQTLTATIRAYARPGDVIVLNPDTDWPVFHYHYRGDLPWVGLPQAEQMTPPEVRSLLEPVWAEHSRLWLVSSVKALSYDPEGNVVAWLNEKGKSLLDQGYGDTRLTLYTRRDDPAGRPALAPAAGPRQVIGTALGDGLTLLGYDQWLRRVQSGQLVPLSLWWQVQAPTRDEYRLRLTLVGDAGRVVAKQRWTALDTTQTDRWTGSAEYRQEYRFPVRADVESGHYRWSIELVDGTSGRQAGRALFGDLEVVQTRRPAAPAGESIAHPIGARLGDEVELVGYDDHQPNEQAGELFLKPGEVLRLSLLWRALRPIDENYTVFVHILGATLDEKRGNYIWGQQDTVPRNGTLPTTGWPAGELVADEYAVPLDEDAPPGEYEIEVGMYERASGHRLPVMTGDGRPEDDRVIIGRARVR